MHLDFSAVHGTNRAENYQPFNDEAHSHSPTPWVGMERLGANRRFAVHGCRRAGSLIIGATGWDGGNPYPELIYRELEASGVDVRRMGLRDWLWHHDRKRAVICLHWIAHLFRPISRLEAARLATGYLVLILILRIRGARLVWVYHNRVSHEQRHPRMDRVASRILARIVTRIVCLTPHGALVAAGELGQSITRKIRVVPHPTFGDIYGPIQDQDKARGRLGIDSDSRVILFFGRVHEYKKVPKLISAFTQVAYEKSVLCIAGEPETDSLGAQIEAATSKDSRILTSLSRVPDSEVATWFSAADWLVLPYADTLNSGVLHLAVTLKCPVILPRTQAYLSALPDLESGVIWFEPDEAGLKAALLQAQEMDAEEINEHRSSIANFGQTRSPSVVATLMRAIFEEAATTRSP